MSYHPEHVWSKRFDAPLADPSEHRVAKPPFLEILKLLPVAYRISNYLSSERHDHREPIFDLHGIALQPPLPGPHGGVGCGGIGGGCMGRGSHGEFRRWSLYPGRYQHHIVTANVFSVRVQYIDGTIASTVLSMYPPEPYSTLKHWNFQVNPHCATYHALFPYCWIEYHQPLKDISIIIKQISPFIPNNYSESSLSCAVFEVNVENLSSHPIDVSIMFTFQNGIEVNHIPFNNITKNHDNERVLSKFNHRVFTTQNDTHQTKVLGIHMSHQSTKTYYHYQDTNQNVEIMDQHSIAIGTDCVNNSQCDVSYCEKFTTLRIPSHSMFDLCASPNDNEEEVNNIADMIWSEFHQHGKITNHRSVAFDEKNCMVGSCLCIKQTITSKATGNYNISLAWDYPIARFGSGQGLSRYYTRFLYPQPVSHNELGSNAHKLATIALLRHKDWVHQITQWQNETIGTIDKVFGGIGDSKDSGSGCYYHMLFNELYYLIDGGTIWSDSHGDGVGNSAWMEARINSGYKLSGSGNGGEESSGLLEGLLSDSNASTEGE